MTQATLTSASARPASATAESAEPVSLHVQAVSADCSLPVRHAAGVDALVGLAGELCPGWGPDETEERRLAVGETLQWLSGWPGENWQQRWVASVANNVAASAETISRPARRRLGTGIAALVALEAIRPGYAWLSCPQARQVAELFRQVHAPQEFASLRRQAGHLDASPVALREALDTVTRVAIVADRSPAHIVPDDLIGYVEEMRAASRTPRHVELAWTLLRETGWLAGAPPTMRQYRQHGQRSVAELVDRYPIACRPVRDLIVGYLSERAPALDYSTLRWLAYRLAVLFWGDLERHNPGIDALRLAPEVAQSWKRRLAYKPDGTSRAQYLDILVSVRSFYLDVAQWALADPATWAPWAAPCPVSEADLAGYPKAMRRRTARMQQRTRTLAPVLPSLVEAASRRLNHAERLLAAASAAEPGSVFDLGDTGYRRVVPRRPNEHRFVRVEVLGGGGKSAANGPRLTPACCEEEAFWAWAVVEVLRQSGVRIEEMLELTHLSLRRYAQPSGELVPLLQVSPSKTDTERVLPIAPELVAVLARIIRRVKAGSEIVPLVSRYDPLEQIASAPLPYLFQRRFGHRPTVLTAGYVRALLDRLVGYAGLRDVDGTPLRFVPHDFRRIFATEAVNSGLPVHIAAKLLGHLDLNTTRGYVAVYPEQVIRHYRDFIDRRRQCRPAEEYREPTAAEWKEFEAHFGQRAVALGTCARPYGSPCAHEHACVRCPMLRVDPAQLPRLETIEVNVRGRLAEALEMNWRGEVAGLEESLRHVINKKEQTIKLLGTEVIAPDSLD